MGNYTNYWSIIFIIFCALMVIAHYYRKFKSQKDDEARGIFPCKEVELAGKPSVLILDDSSEESEKKVKKFIHDSTDLDFDIHCKLERDDNELKIIMNKNLNFYDVANIVNIYTWLEDGSKNKVSARYFVKKMTIGPTEITDTEVLLYVDPDEEKEWEVDFLANEQRYEYDLGNERATILKD